MIKRESDNTIEIDFGSENNFDDIVEELFWKDLNFEIIDGVYIHDTNQGRWYSVERKYWYGNFNDIVKSNKVVTFDRVSSDTEKELDEEFYEDF